MNKINRTNIHLKTALQKMYDRMNNLTTQRFIFFDYLSLTVLPAVQQFPLANLQGW